MPHARFTGVDLGGGRQLLIDGSLKPEFLPKPDSDDDSDDDHEYEFEPAFRVDHSRPFGANSMVSSVCEDSRRTASEAMMNG